MPPGLPELELIIQERARDPHAPDERDRRGENPCAGGRSPRRAAWAMTRSLRVLSLRLPSCDSTKANLIRSSSPSAPSRSLERSDDASAIRDSQEASRSRPHMVGLDRRSPRGPLRVSCGRAERDDAGIGAPLFYLCIVEERAGRLALAQAHAERKRELAYQDGGRSLRTHLPCSCRSRAWRRCRGTWISRGSWPSERAPILESKRPSPSIALR